MNAVETVKNLIEKAIPDSEAMVEDMTGSGDHLRAIVVSRTFEGESRVKQHRMVYEPLRQLMSDQTVHALALKTYTPAQWAKVGGSS